MSRIDLTEKEAAALMEVLESALSDLKTERVRTDNRELHARFVEQESLVSAVLKRLANPGLAESGSDYAQ